MNIELVLKITDYVLLNAYSLSSSGLYYGKSGISLALFEVSRLLEDDYLEEHAFELLQSFLFSSSEEELESKLLKIVNSAGANISYAHGLARWLLYVAYVESLERGLDVSRFDNLFKLVPAWER